MHGMGYNLGSTRFILSLLSFPRRRESSHIIRKFMDVWMGSNNHKRGCIFIFVMRDLVDFYILPVWVLWIPAGACPRPPSGAGMTNGETFFIILSQLLERNTVSVACQRRLCASAKVAPAKIKRSILRPVLAVPVGNVGTLNH